MLDLLSAGIHRYLKRPLTYLCFAASLICGITYIITSVYTSENVDFFHPDDFYFILSIIAITRIPVDNNVIYIIMIIPIIELICKMYNLEDKIEK